MKNNILFILLLVCTFTAAQTIDTIKWVNYSNTFSIIKFEYPSFMLLEKNFNSNISEIDSVITLSFTDYPLYGIASDWGRGDSTDTLHYDLFQSLDIVVSKLSLDEIAKNYDYIKRDSVWFDLEMYKMGLNDEPASIYNVNDWFGFYTYTPTRVYLKEGGCITAAGDRGRFFLYKKFTNEKVIYVFGERFDFDNSDIVLQKILDSIKFKK